MKSTSVQVVSTYEIFPVMKDLIEQGQGVKFTVSGSSMLPLISGNRDQVMLISAKDRKLKLGDIILFQNSQGKYILHRIYKTEEKGFRTIGDACLVEDGLVAETMIIGLVDKIYRKEVEINCDSYLWRLVFSIWRRLMPIRKYLLSLYFFMIRIKKKINRTGR